MSRTYRSIIGIEQSIPPEFKFIDTNAGRNIQYFALRYIDDHYHEKIYASQVANYCGLHVSQFCRTFKSVQGQTFHQFLIQFRIEKACDFLKNRYASVVDVAFSVGFNDHSYFTHVFQRVVGINPSAYREQKEVLGMESQPCESTNLIV